MSRTIVRGVALAVLLAATAAPVAAAPWASVGDDQLRADLTLLDDAGIARTMVTQWPVPWAGVADALQDSPALDAQPAYIRQAIRRVRARALRETAVGGRAETRLDATNRPALVRGFDAEGYGKGTIQETAEITAGRSDLHVQVGAIAGQKGQHGVQFDADGSYLAQRFGSVQLYGGEITHWWGPGWASALTYSNNARPFPQIGIATAGPVRFKTPLLSWIGPFRAEALVGVLDDTRFARSTVFDAVRLTLNPARGLQIGAARTQILCGRGNPCSFGDGFALTDNTASARTAAQGEFDVRYGWRAFGVPLEAYAQVMNEGSNPVRHSNSSYLVGGSVYIPVALDALRLTAEYASSLATANLFSFDTPVYGVGYTAPNYPDGLRYRGRDFGFSLDGDSRLYTLQANLTDSFDRNYTLSLHRALVSRLETGAANPLTPLPVTINYAEARVATPFYIGVLSVSGRIQDDQLRPAHGFTAAAEVSFRVRVK